MSAEPVSSCSSRAMRIRSPSWAARIASVWRPDEDVYAYFNNDLHGCAPRNARTFASAAGGVGLRPSRVPGRGEAPLTL